MERSYGHFQQSSSYRKFQAIFAFSEQIFYRKQSSGAPVIYILAFILLNLLTTSAYSTFPTSLLLLYQFKYSSGFNSQSWTCLGQLTRRVSIVYLIANIATGLVLLGNRLAYAQPQLTSAKERRSALTPQTQPPELTSDNAKRITFLIWQ